MAMTSKQFRERFQPTPHLSPLNLLNEAFNRWVELDMLIDNREKELREAAYAHERVRLLHIIQNMVHEREDLWMVLSDVRQKRMERDATTDPLAF